MSKCEHNTKRLQFENTEIDQLKAQTMDEIDCSFTEVIKALEKRKQKLKRDIDEHFMAEMPQFEQTKNSYESLMKSMQSKTEFLKNMMEHASDFDILSCADHVFQSAENMASQNNGFPDGFGVLSIESATPSGASFTIDVCDASNNQLVVDGHGNVLTGLTGSTIELWDVDASVYSLLNHAVDNAFKEKTQTMLGLIT